MGQPSPSPNRSDAVAEVPASRRWRTALLLVAAVAMALPLWIGIPALRAARESERNVVLSAASPLESIENGIQISPDGNYLVFSGRREHAAEPTLWLLRLNRTAPEELAGTGGASFPFWSPEGRRVGFFAAGELRILDLDSRSVRPICRVAAPRGGDWNRKDEILFGSGETGGLSRVSLAAGKPMPATSLADGESGHFWPRFLPDGNHFIYTSVSSREGNPRIMAGALDSRWRTPVGRSSSNAVLTCGSGQEICELLYLTGRNLVSRAINTRTWQAVGADRFVLPDITCSRELHLAAVSVSGTGVLSYSQSDGLCPRRLVFLDRAGHKTGEVPATGRLVVPRISPDGTRIAFARLETDGTGGIWVADAAGHIEQVTHEPIRTSFPVWSPDSQKMVYARWRENTSDLYVRELGRPDFTLLRKNDYTKVPTSWSRDGRFIAYDWLPHGFTSGWEIWILPLVGAREPFPLVQASSTGSVMDAQFSPDGNWVAYSSSERGRLEVYAVPFRGKTLRESVPIQISVGGGADPRWSRDGDELFYIDNQHRLTAVDFKEPPERGQRRVLFNLVEVSPNGGDIPAAGYDVSPDGTRFLFPVADLEDQPRQVRVTRIDLLRARKPSGALYADD